MSNKKAYGIGLLAIVLLPVVVAAQSPFDGTWKTDMSKAKLSTKPLVYVLQNGIYECKTCPVPFSIKADGQDQKVAGNPYRDTISVKVVDDHTIEMTSKKDGRITGTNKRTVSADGYTLTNESSDSSVPDVAPVNGKEEWKRVAKGPAGSHLFSGSWLTEKGNYSDNGLTFTGKFEGNTMTYSSAAGQSYTAKLDGTDAPYKGDPGVDTVSVKRLATNIIEETDKYKGKVIVVTKSTVSADGKTMTSVVSNKLVGTTQEFVAVKQ